MTPEEVAAWKQNEDQKELLRNIILGVIVVAGAVAAAAGASSGGGGHQGCCSWHGGIAGCAPDGRLICADGVESPSCRCQ